MRLQVLLLASAITPAGTLACSGGDVQAPNSEPSNTPNSGGGGTDTPSGDDGESTDDPPNSPNNTSVPGAYTAAKIITTSKAGDKLAEVPGTVLPEGTSTGAKIVVDPAERQEVFGFGTSLTESAGQVLNTLAPEKRQELINAMFKPHPEGANYVLTRLPMASCDFSTGNYTYAAAESTDLADFSVEVDKDDIIPLTKDALAASGGKLRVMSSPWSPPPWMKTGAEDEAGFVGGRFNPAYSSVYADYFVKYVQAYEAEGIPIWSMTPQNEPEHVGNFETCGFSPGEMATFLGDHLGPRLEEAGYGDILLFGFDHNKGSSLVNFANGIYANPAAAKYTDGMAHHWYGSTASFEEASLATVHNSFPDKLLIASEQSVDNFAGVSADAWQNDDWWWGIGAQDWCDHSWCSDPENHPYYKAVNRYVKDIILDFNNWNNGWISWNAALYQSGQPNWFGVTCSADVMIGEENGEIYFPPTFYAVQQFSRYLRPGAKVHASSTDAAGLLSLAAVNTDGTLSTVVFNEGDAPITYQVTYLGQSVEATVPGPGVQTIEFR